MALFEQDLEKNKQVEVDTEEIDLIQHISAIISFDPCRPNNDIAP